MKKLYYLNLPLIPDDLKDTLIRAADSIPPDEPGRQWVEHFHNNQVRAASHVYGRDNTILPQEIQNKIQQIYGPYFNNTKIIGMVGKFENTYGDGVVECPPHCDRWRNFSINYLLKSGGSDVQTVFYNEYRQIKPMSEAENGLHKNLTIDFKICIPEEVWHSYDVQNYHSVENLENSRLMFSLVLVNNPTFKEFKEQFESKFQ